MRDIVFRGKVLDEPDTWIQGNLTQRGENQWFILTDFGDYDYEVIPETIGQYTGCHDRNGKPIFEGDVVFTAIFGKVFSGVVKWINSESRFTIELVSSSFNRASYVSPMWSVVGNIYDTGYLR